MYIVEGNIGTGKSTFLKLVSRYLPSVQVTFEPVAEWQKEIAGASILKNFYHNPQRWAYTMETVSMVHRVRGHMQEQQTFHTKLIERSIYSGHYCFAQNDYFNGFMTDTEWQLYNQWFNFLVPKHCKPPRGFIYLQSDPAIAFNRVKQRNRNGEQSISIDYLAQIDTWHRVFLIQKQNILNHLIDVPVLILDVNEEFETNEKKAAQLMHQVASFLADTGSAIL